MSAPSLADLLDLDRLGVCESIYTNNTLNYQVKCSEDSHHIKMAISNTVLVLSNRIEAVTELLLVIEGNCEDQITSDTKYNALWLLKELMQTLRAATEQELLLERSVNLTKPGQGQSKITKLKQQA